MEACAFHKELQCCAKRRIWISGRNTKKYVNQGFPEMTPSIQSILMIPFSYLLNFSKAIALFAGRTALLGSRSIPRVYLSTAASCLPSLNREFPWNKIRKTKKYNCKCNQNTSLAHKYLKWLPYKVTIIGGYKICQI